MPGHRPPRGRAAPRRAGRADALQRRRAWPRRTTAPRWPCFSPPPEAGKTLHVYADETRPLLQGARLTAWELQQRGIDVTLICDSMAAQVMRDGRVQAVVTGADRIAANGDVANKIGTYGLAVLAAAHGIPFYVAAPSSTFDLSIAERSGDSHRTARPPRGHTRLRPADGARGGGSLQSGLRRDPRRADLRHHLRARRHPARKRRNDRRHARPAARHGPRVAAVHSRGGTAASAAPPRKPSRIWQFSQDFCTKTDPPGH